MTGDKFVRRVRLGRKRGVVVCFESRKDTGSHGRLQYGDRFNAVEGLRKKISYGLLAASLPLRRQERHPEVPLWEGLTGHRALTTLYLQDQRLRA